MLGVSVSPPSTFYSRQSKTQASPYNHGLSSITPCISSSSDAKLKAPFGLRIVTATESHRISIRCNSSTGPGGPASGDRDSRSVLDAFFLGKAVAEALSERIESTVGEFLSTIGRLQAEQQKQIEDFQEDVLGRVKKSKEKAAREAMEAQGLIPKATTVDTTAENYGVSPATSPSTIKADTPANSPSSSPTTIPAVEMYEDPAAKGRVAGGASNDD